MKEKKKKTFEHFKRIESKQLNWGTRNANSTTSVTTKYFYWFPIICKLLYTLRLNSLLSFCIPFVLFGSIGRCASYEFTIHSKCFECRVPQDENISGWCEVRDDRRTHLIMLLLLLCSDRAVLRTFMKFKNIHWLEPISSGRVSTAVDNDWPTAMATTAARNRNFVRDYFRYEEFFFVHSISYRSSFKSTTTKKK